MEPVKQFVVEGPSGEEMSSFQPGIHPTSLEFNFAQQPIIQPSPVQNVISILEKYLEEKDDKVSQSRHEVHVEKISFGNNIKDLDVSSADGQVENQDSLLAGNKSDIERTSSSVESDTNANFKYVMVDKNGAPDWSKVLHLDKNIIQEVCKKHGVNLDEMTSGKAEGKSGKKQKKKRKSKKSKTEKQSGQQDKNIPCTLCDKTFQSKRHLRDHMRYHTGKKLHCLDCDYVTVRQQQLDYHMNTHTGKRPFVCDVCNKGFRHPTGLSCHKKTHRGHTGAVSCDICKMEFEQPHQLDRHMQTHKEERPHQCGFCTNNFKRAMDLRMHIKFYHSEIADKVDQIVPKESTPPEPEGDFKCRQCDRSFKTTQGLEQHKRRTHNSDVKRKNLLVKCRDGEQKYACQRCQKQFNSRKALINHRFTHTTVRPYTCTICGRSFKRQWELHKHKMMTHTQQPSVPCTQCDAQFPGRGNLRRHMMRMHSDSKKTTPKPYRCEICLRAYARKPELAEHQNIHTGDRPYMCDTCGKTFSFRSALACHKKLHEVEGAILCDLCGKRFGSRMRMQEHRVMHTGEKRFSCQYCGTKYKYPSNLRWHLNKAHKKGPCGGRTNSRSAQQKRHELIRTISKYQPHQLERVLTTEELAAIQHQLEISLAQKQAERQQQLESEQPVTQIQIDTGEVHQFTTDLEQYGNIIQLPPNVVVQHVPIRSQEELGQDVLSVAEFVLQTSEGSRVLQTEDGSLIIEPIDSLQTTATIQ